MKPVSRAGVLKVLLVIGATGCAESRAAPPRGLSAPPGSAAEGAGYVPAQGGCAGYTSPRDGLGSAPASGDESTGSAGAAAGKDSQVAEQDSGGTSSLSAAGTNAGASLPAGAAQGSAGHAGQHPECTGAAPSGAAAAAGAPGAAGATAGAGFVPSGGVSAGGASAGHPGHANSAGAAHAAGLGGLSGERGSGAAPSLPGIGGVAGMAGTSGAASDEPRGSPASLRLSEVLYDPEGLDDGREWIELYNGGAAAIELSGLTIEVSTSGAYRAALALSGRVAGQGCVVVGGPALGSAAGNYTSETFSYQVASDFSPDLGNATSPSDGIHLVTASHRVIDSVVYGAPNLDGIVSPDGVPELPMVADAESGQSLERLFDGTWRVQPVPTPGDCAALQGGSSVPAP